MLTITQAVREALKTVDDPETADTKRLLAIARAKLAQSGNRAGEIVADDISKVRYRLRNQLNKPLTRQKILEYETTLTRVRPSANGVAKPAEKPALKKLAPVVGEATVSLAHLRLAKDFAQAVGGVKKAVHLFRCLEDILP